MLKKVLVVDDSAGGNQFDAVVPAARGLSLGGDFRSDKDRGNNRGRETQRDPSRRGNAATKWFSGMPRSEERRALLADSGDSRDVKDGPQRSLLGRATGRKRLCREAVHARRIDQRGEKVCLMAGKPEEVRENAGLPLELVGGEFLESETLSEERLPERQYCVFRAGRERFCLSVLEVEEVVDWPIVTRIPLAPAFLMGVFNLRGTIVPLVDIAFTEGRRPGLLPKHVVVAALKGDAQRDDLRVGIASDEVIGTYSATEEALLDQAPNDVPHCRGMLRHDDRLALVVDLRRLTDVFPVPVI